MYLEHQNSFEAAGFNHNLPHHEIHNNLNAMFGQEQNSRVVRDPPSHSNIIQLSLGPSSAEKPGHQEQEADSSIQRDTEISNVLLDNTIKSKSRNSRAKSFLAEKEALH